jgi:hypothetical protein
MTRSVALLSGTKAASFKNRINACFSVGCIERHSAARWNGQSINPAEECLEQWPRFPPTQLSDLLGRLASHLFLELIEVH